MHSHALMLLPFMAVCGHCIKPLVVKAGRFYPLAFITPHDLNLTQSPTARRSSHLRKAKGDTFSNVTEKKTPRINKKCEPNVFSEETMVQKNAITTNSTIDLPFSAAVAFDAFSDVTRQPSWSPWLHSVSYVDGDAAKSETEWKMKLLGFKYSWRAISTRSDRPHVIEWESTSGLRNGGRVQFEPLISEAGEDYGHCKMTMSMNFIAPRPVVLMFQNKIENLFREKILKRTLSQFREVVAAENSI